MGAILYGRPEGEKEGVEECGEFGDERGRCLAEERSRGAHFLCRHFLLFGILDCKSNLLFIFYKNPEYIF